MGGRIAISGSTGGRVDRHLREYRGTGGSPSQRVLADGRIAISESTGGSPSQGVLADGWIAISGSGSKGRLVDRHLREYWRMGGLQSQRVRADWRIAISESTGGQADRRMRDFGRTGVLPAQRVRGGRADRHLRDYRQNIGSESKGRQVDRHLR